MTVAIDIGEGGRAAYGTYGLRLTRKARGHVGHERGLRAEVDDHGPATRAKPGAALHGHVAREHDEELLFSVVVHVRDAGDAQRRLDLVEVGSVTERQLEASGRNDFLPAQLDDDEEETPGGVGVGIATRRRHGHERAKAGRRPRCGQGEHPAKGLCARCSREVPDRLGLALVARLSGHPARGLRGDHPEKRAPRRAGLRPGERRTGQQGASEGQRGDSHRSSVRAGAPKHAHREADGTCARSNALVTWVGSRPP